MMSADLDRDEDLTARLQALGCRPVPPATQSQHLTAMAGLHRSSAFRSSVVGRLKLGAGVLAGFLIGATGLTTAGALGPLQPIAADVMEAATPLKGLPESASAKAKERSKKAERSSTLADGSTGTQRTWGPECVPLEGKPGVFAGSRGQYLKQERAKGAAAFQAAKASTCGSPNGATGRADEEGTGSAEAPKAEKAPKPDKGPKAEITPGSTETPKAEAPKVEEAPKAEAPKAIDPPKAQDAPKPTEPPAAPQTEIAPRAEEAPKAPAAESVPRPTDPPKADAAPEAPEVTVAPVTPNTAPGQDTKGDEPATKDKAGSATR